MLRLNYISVCLLKVDPSLVDVVQAIADLENTATEINSLSVVINGNTYAVDPTTITTTSSATCDTGYYADGTSCSKILTILTLSF